MRKNVIVAGTGFEGRAEIIRAYCKKGKSIALKREPSNEHDTNAIAVYLEQPRLFGFWGKSLKKVGYIKANAAKSLAKKMDSGVRIKASVSSYFAPVGIDHPRVSIEVSDEMF